VYVSPESIHDDIEHMEDEEHAAGRASQAEAVFAVKAGISGH
jgi:hypothetical protein